MLDYRQFYESVMGLHNEQLLERLVRNSMYRIVNAKEYLMLHGEPITVLWILVSGMIRGVVITSDGKEITDCFTDEQGELLYASSQVNLDVKAEIDIQALTTSEFIGVPMDIVMEYVKKRDPEVVEIYFKAMEKGAVRHLEIERIRLQPVADRIQWFYDKIGERGSVMENQYIASLLNMDKSTFCRKKREMNLRK